MKIFLAGDHYSGTGPANVTKYYIENLTEPLLYQKRRSKASRVPEIILNTLKADVVVYSGYSKQNILGLKFAKRLNRPSAYIMHGCVEYENEINLEPDPQMNRIERKTMELADLILAVSAGFEDFLKEHYPEYAGKISHVTNGIDLSLSDGVKRKEVDPHMIFSIGGGMPRKKIRYICEAVEKLRKEYDRDMYLCVAGDSGADSEAINSYGFVKNLGIVPFEETKRLFDRAALFVQNSCFETFGLAPVEAIECGCPVLCSAKAGALSVMGQTKSEDIIERFDDIDEISAKIIYNLENPNAKRLYDGIDREKSSWKAAGMSLTQKLSELVLKK